MQANYLVLHTEVFHGTRGKREDQEAGAKSDVRVVVVFRTSVFHDRSAAANYRNVHGVVVKVLRTN